MEPEAIPEKILQELVYTHTHTHNILTASYGDEREIGNEAVGPPTQQLTHKALPPPLILAHIT